MDGDILKLEAVEQVTVTQALDWLALKLERQEQQIELQAALHGAKLRKRQQAGGTGGLVGRLRAVAGKEMQVQRVAVSKEELERRKKMDGVDLVDRGE